MVYRKGRDTHAVCIEHDQWRVSHHERHRHAASATWWHDGGAVVRGAIAIVQGIGCIEASNDALHALGTRHWQRRRVGRARPAQQQQRAKAVDMIRMEMRQEQPLDASGWQPHQRQVARAAFTGIDDIDMSPGDHHGAGAGARWIGKWRTAAAQDDVQAIGQAKCCITPGAVVGNARQQHCADLRLENLDGTADNRGQSHRAQQQFAHPPHGVPPLAGALCQHDAKLWRNQCQNLARSVKPR